MALLSIGSAIIARNSLEFGVTASVAAAVSREREASGGDRDDLISRVATAALQGLVFFTHFSYDLEYSNSPSVGGMFRAVLGSAVVVFHVHAKDRSRVWTSHFFAVSNTSTAVRNISAIWNTCSGYSTYSFLAINFCTLLYHTVDAVKRTQVLLMG